MPGLFYMRNLGANLIAYLQPTQAIWEDKVLVIKETIIV